MVQTSAARVPKVVRDLAAEDHTARGIVAPREVEAVNTVALVLLLIVVMAEAIVALTAVVTAAMFVESEVDAFKTALLVFALTTPAIDEDAVATIALVFALTALVLLVIFVASEVEALSTIALVLVLTTPAIDDEAVATMAFVFALTADVTAAILVESDVEAFVTSDCTARDPLERAAPVSVLTLLVHTSAAKVPNVVRDLLVYDQIVAGNEARVEASEVEAFNTVELVLALTTPAIDDEAVPTMLFVFALTAEVPAVMFVARDVDAFRTAEFVLELMAEALLVIFAANDVEAFKTSDWSASEPEDSVAPVRFLVP